MMNKNWVAAGAAFAIGAAALINVFPAFAAEITADRAKEIAMDHAGVKESDVVHIQAKKDREDGQLIYEVEFYTGDHREYDYEILVADGSILSYDCEAEYRRYDAAGTGSAIDLEEAKAAALADAGLTADEVTIYKVKTDWDDGWLIYEVKFYTSDGSKYDYEIDASTGRILSRDVDAGYHGKWRGRNS